MHRIEILWRPLTGHLLEVNNCFYQLYQNAVCINKDLVKMHFLKVIKKMYLDVLVYAFCICNLNASQFKFRSECMYLNFSIFTSLVDFVFMVLSSVYTFSTQQF